MIEKSEFGHMPDGRSVESYTLSNQAGVSVEILTLGASIRSWQLVDSQHTDIVLGFDTVADYLADQGYMGRTVGRYANRIAKGQFTIAEETFQVSTNLQGNCLHGGVDGFHNRIWQVTQLNDLPFPSITLSLISEDGDQGFPGELTMSVTFTLDDKNSLDITYRASSDKDTVFNPTQHVYFNLAGHSSGGIHGHTIKTFASHYTPSDAQAIPTGEISPTQNSVFDLHMETSLAGLIDSDDPEIRAASGLDHNWCIDGFDGSQQKMLLAAVASEPHSGRKLVVHTTMPGMQIYTGNFIGEKTLGKAQTAYAPYSGFCIETQFYPDSPNQASFPSALLKAGDEFVSRTNYQLITPSHTNAIG